MSRMNCLSAAAACLALFSGVGGAYAQSERILYGDLNLWRADDALTFAHRVDAASDRLCRQRVAPMSAAYQSERRDCIKAVRDEAYAALPPVMSDEPQVATNSNDKSRTGT